MTLSATFYAAGYIVGALAFFTMARRRGMATQVVGAVMVAGLIGGLAAGNLSQWLFAGSPGKSILGAVAGGYLAVILYKRWIGLNRPTGDLFAVALCAGEAVGRWGCYFGGCCHGKTTTVSWAVWQHDAWRHPTQIYLSACCLAILVVLLLVDARRPPENSLLFLHGMLYSIARFCVEAFRVAPEHYGGLNIAQWACIVGAVFFGFKLNQAWRRNRQPASAVVTSLRGEKRIPTG